MKQPPSRRDFIIKTGKASLGIYIGSNLLSSCSPVSKLKSDKYITAFQQQPLPYNYNALSEAIDGTTMEIHYTKHAAGYATNLNEAAKNEGVDSSKPLEDTLRKISKYSTKLRNNAGGHYNHELFWKCMAPNGAERPSGKLATAIESGFGSFDAFKTQFSDAGKNHFGSGWAWLIIDNDKKLRISSTPNQDNPLMDLPAAQAGAAEVKGFPILGLDVWEHAYYLRYQNKRADYITNWWKVVNWHYLQERYESLV